MKRIFAFLLALFAITASATTLVPIQLLNPTGSSSGQAIVSTGASSAPGWSALGIGSLSAISANSVVGNATGSSAAPTAVSITGCNGAAQALQWTNGSGFGCNSNVATAGANSNITSLAAPTITTPNIQGVTNGAAAAAGQVGQVVLNSASGVALTSGSSANCTSVSLTAGDWDIRGNVYFLPAGTTTQSQLVVGMNTVSATLPAIPNFSVLTLAIAAGNVMSLIAPPQVVNVSATTTLYLIANATFATSTETVSCSIVARRVH